MLQTDVPLEVNLLTEPAVADSALEASHLRVSESVTLQVSVGLSDVSTLLTGVRPPPDMARLVSTPVRRVIRRVRAELTTKQAV